MTKVGWYLLKPWVLFTRLIGQLLTKASRGTAEVRKLRAEVVSLREAVDIERTNADNARRELQRLQGINAGQLTAGPGRWERS